MAVPTHMTVDNLKGTFVINKELSDHQDGVFTLQGLPYPIRQILKVLNMKIEIEVAPANGSEPSRVTFTYSLSGAGAVALAPLRAVGLPVSRTEVRKLDGSTYEQDEPVLGHIVGRVWMCNAATLKGEEVLDEYLTSGWNDRVLRTKIENYASKKKIEREDDPTWVSQIVCGFEEVISGTGRERRYVARMRVSKGKGADTQTERARLVYDFKS